MLNDQELATSLANCPAPRVTEELIVSKISDTSFTKIGEKVTVCTITLKNGFTVVGEAACVNVANYNQEIGETIAQKIAFSKLWPLFGFWLAEVQYFKDQSPNTAVQEGVSNAA